MKNLSAVFHLSETQRRGFYYSANYLTLNAKTQ